MKSIASVLGPIFANITAWMYKFIAWEEFNENAKKHTVGLGRNYVIPDDGECSLD